MPFIYVKTETDQLSVVVVLVKGALQGLAGKGPGGGGGVKDAMQGLTSTALLLFWNKVDLHGTGHFSAFFFLPRLKIL